MKNSLKFMAGIVALSTLTAVTSAAPITPGNLVIVRFGDGVAALTGNATAMFLDEYTTSGTLVQSLPVSSAGADACCVTGTSSTEGVLTLAQDGSRLVFTGYRKDVGLTSPSLVQKAIGTVTLAGTVDSTISTTDFAVSGTGAVVRSATTVDGSSYWVAAGAALRYIATPGGASVVVDARNSRQVALFDNVLYASNGSTAVAGKLQHYGVLPTTATTPTPVVNLVMATDAVHGFAVLDLSTAIAGADTIYCLSTVENLLRKYTFDGTTWNPTGALTAGGGVNLTTMKNGANVDVYITTGTKLMVHTDTSGFGGTLDGVNVDIVTAATNTGFRGLAYFPAAAGANLTGSVTLNDYTLTPDTKTVTVEIYSADGSTLLETINSVALSSSGNFSVAHSQAAGTYDVYVKADHWLRKLSDDVALNPGGSAGSFSLTNGDVDGDNEVGPGDFGNLTSAFGSMDGDNNWNPLADLDGDGEVGPSDFGILTANFGEGGD